MRTDFPADFTERLWPSPGLLITLLLLIPATMLTIFPINAAIALPVAIAVYAIIAGSLVLMSPVLRVSDGHLVAGSARVPVELLGQVTVLDDAQLRRTIGPGADARAYLLVRGFIHRGVRVEIEDAADPTPYWVLTSRRPRQLAEAITAAKSV